MKQPITMRAEPTDIQRAEDLASQLNLTRTVLIERAFLIGLDELEHTADVIRTPVLGLILNLIASMSDEATAEEFKKIRTQLLQNRAYLAEGRVDLFSDLKTKGESL